MGNGKNRNHIKMGKQETENRKRMMHSRFLTDMLLAIISSRQRKVFKNRQ